MSDDSRTISNDNNPILNKNVPHYFKVYILRWGTWLLRNNHINNKKPFQICAASLWNNSFLGTDIEDNFLESCTSDYARSDVINELREFIKGTKSNENTFDDGWARIECYKNN